MKKHSHRVLAVVSRLWIAALVLIGGAQAASLSVHGTLTQGASSSSCTYTSMTETATGNWTVNCGAGSKTITINPKLCGTVCTSYSSLLGDAAGNWTVTGCTSTINAGVNLVQPSAPIPSHPIGTTLRLKATAVPCSGEISGVEFYANDGLVPGTVTFVSPSQYEIDWTPTTSGDYLILAKATNSGGGVTPSQAVNVYVNIPPAITSFGVTSPGTSASPPGPRANPATFVLSASATDVNNITRIEFRRSDGSWVQGAAQNGASASYQYSWQNAPVGTYDVIARAYDSRGAFTNSSPVTLTVTSGNNSPTDVRVAKPVAGTSVNLPVALEATAQDSDGHIVRIDYYDASVVNGPIIATGTVAPNFPAPWSNPTCSSCSVYARAVDNGGLSTQSASVAFTVTQPFRMYLSASGTYPYMSPATVTMNVLAWAAPAVTSVTLYRDGQDLGTFTNAGPAEFQKVVSGLGAGLHRFKARGTSQSGEMGETNETIVFVDAAAPAVAPGACPAEDPSGTEVTAAITGSAAVTEMGAASYSIPIQVPPGIAGLAPSLALTYGSQGGNGLAGAGWSLQGLSVIHRCPKSIFLDGKKSSVAYYDPYRDGAHNVDAADALCLDGQRLVPVTDVSANSARNARIEYRTEREGYSKIESFNPFDPNTQWAGPAYFKVTTKSGQILYYGLKVTEGNPADPPQDAVVRTYPIGLASMETARIWALYRIEDRVGNAIVIDYDTSNENGTQRPSSIRYTLNRTTGVIYANRVDFGYETRGDLAELFDSGGQRFYETQRLKTITTYADGAAVKKYTLSYEASAATTRSLLKNVQECSGDGLLCLNPTAFEWKDVEANIRRLDASGSGTWIGTSTGNDRDTTRAVEIDGDGKTDLVSRKNSLTQWDVCKSTGSGFSCVVWTSGPRAEGEGRDDIWHLADFDGDGKADLVYLSNADFNNVILQRSTGSGFLPPESAGASWPGAVNPANNPYAHTVGDFDGDGRVDLALYFGDAQWKFCRWTGSQFVCDSGLVTIEGADQPYNSPRAGFDYVVGDFNGDGRADIAWHSNNSNEWRVCRSVSRPGSGSQPTVFAFDCYRNGSVIQSPAILQNADTTHVADFNGDGMADLMAPEHNGSGLTGRWEVCMSRGDGTFKCIYPTPTAPTLTKRENATLGDFNGDGRTDIALRTASGTLQICLSTGTAFDCGGDPAPPWPGISNASDELKSLRLGDFNGDGKTDVASWSESLPQWSVGLAGGGPPDLIKKASNGLNVVTSFAYKPLTDSGIYAKDNDAIYPEVEIQSPLYVVSHMESAPPAAVFYTTVYSYRGLKGHARGAGMAGFKKRAVSDPQSQMCAETETETNWDERRVGLVKVANKRYVSSVGVLGASGTCTGANNEISRVTNSWATRPANTWSGLTDAWQTPSQSFPIFEVFLVGSLESKWDLSRAELPASSMSLSDDPSMPLSLSKIDVFGNTKFVLTSTWLPSIPGEVYKKTTVSTYQNTTSTWIVGRVIEASVTNTLPYTPVNSSNPTRLSRFAYDGNTGLLVSETVEPNRSSTSEYLRTDYTYDSFGNRQTATAYGLGLGAAGRTTKTRYCVNGAASAFCAIDGRFPTYMENAVGHDEKRTFDARFGLPRVVTGPNGLTTQSNYDKLGRKFCETRADGSTTGWKWTVGGDGGAYVATTRDSAAKDSASNPDGVVSEQHFDALSREVTAKTKAFDGTWAETKSTYDGRGRKWKVVKPSGGRLVPSTGTLPDGSTEGTWILGFDDLNRVTSESGPENYTSTSIYNGVKSSVTVTGQSGFQKTEKTINPRGEVVNIEDAHQNHLKLQYDHFGNLEKKSVTAGLVDGLAEGVGTAPTTLIYFNARGQKTGMNDPDQGSWTYGYNALGEMTSQMDAWGQQSTFEFDSIGRMFHRAEPGLETTWTFDAISGLACGSASKGKLCRVTHYNGSSDYTYDALGRVTNVKQTLYDGRVFQRFMAYDGMSRIRQLVYPITGLTLSYEYNAGTPHLRRIVEAGGTVPWQVVARYKDGQIKRSLTRASETTKEYDTQGRPKSISNGNIQKASYTFDALGNLMSRSDTATGVGLSEDFVYDSLNRLREVYGPAPKSYQYDALGNLKSNAGAPITYYPSSHRVKTHLGKTHLYDVNGDYTGSDDLDLSVVTTGFRKVDAIYKFIDGTVKSYQYDYDHNHQRVIERRVVANSGVATTYYVSDGITPFFEEEQEYPANAPEVTRFKHYIGTPEGVTELIVVNRGLRTQRQLARDHLGSVTVISGDEIPEEYLGYDAWGRRRNANGTDNPNATSTRSDRGFTGHEMLDLYGIGFINMNGRFYDPVLGRVLQPDPIVQAPLNLQSYNRYSYVMNNPLSLTDPTGYSWWTDNGRPAFRIIAAIAVAYMTGYYNYGAYGTGVFGASGSTFATGGWAAVGNAAAGGFAAGGIMGGNLRSASQGAFAAVLTFGLVEFTGVGHPAVNPITHPAHFAAKALVHAASGCASASLSGGECGHGAAGAAIGEAAVGLAGNDSVLQFVAGAVAGGIGSKIAGGKFETGAFSAAFAYLFNQLAEESMAGARPAVTSEPPLVLSFVPGFDAWMCITGGQPCSTTDWAFAALGIIPSGSGAKAVGYSVAFETTIAKVGVGTRPGHFAGANMNLAAAMKADAGLAKIIGDLGITVPKGGQSPASWTWHHVPDRPGVMQLVPRNQHQGGPWQSILHPNQQGGFKTWGRDY